MLRVVSYRKAILAGAAGALAWEVVVRLLALLGLPVFDMVRELGTLVADGDEVGQWWPAGIAAHALTGAAWALFYAYFFWARYRWPPIFQGLAFAVIPAALAIFIAVPQLHLMHLHQAVATVDWKIFLFALSAPQITGLLVGHAVFGMTVGALYTHPVGYSAKRPPRSLMRQDATPRRERRQRRADEASFIFATGIECSYPTTERGRWRRDQMAASGHYRRWREDFELARELGVTHIRYGPPLHLIFTGPGTFDWSWCDEPLRELVEIGPEPIVDLCHFGLPTWLGTFQNPDISSALTEYAGEFATRYPDVRFYTPINEIYVCARMSALQGFWNEQRTDESAFVQAVINLATACVGMTEVILQRRPDAVFINSESSEFCQACCPDEGIHRLADFENERRFLPLDLIYANEVSPRMQSYLREQGVEDDLYRRFMTRKVPRRSVIGLDYYEWNEKLIDRHGKLLSLGELFGWYVIASQYWERYRRTLMHTETNRTDASDAPRWLWRQWHNVQLLRRAGVPIIGFTWYSLIDQVDWDRAIEEALGVVYPVGLFDLNRDPRVVGLSYKHLIDGHRGLSEYRDCPAVRELLS